MQTNFLLGSLQITEDAQAELKRLPYDLLARHAINDHGLITDAERQQNAHSMRVIGTITSRYLVDPTNPRAGHVRIETDRTWSETLISLE
jgi:hypothetical protein